MKYKHIIEIKSNLPVTTDFYINVYNRFYHTIYNGFYFDEVTLIGNSQLYIRIIKTDNNENLEYGNNRGIQLLAVVGLAGILAGVLLTIKITNKKVEYPKIGEANILLSLIGLGSILYLLKRYKL